MLAVNCSLSHHIISANIDYTCPWFYIEKQLVKFPNGHKGDSYILKKQTPFFSVIIAKEQTKFIVIKNWRPTVKDWVWEFPMGGMDQGENAQTAAEREFMEETGHKAKKWTEIGRVHVAPGHTPQVQVNFFAENVEAVPGGEENNPAEPIKVHKFTESQIDDMIKSGKLMDGPSIAAWMQYKLAYKMIQNLS